MISATAKEITNQLEDATRKILSNKMHIITEALPTTVISGIISNENVRAPTGEDACKLWLLMPNKTNNYLNNNFL